MINQNVYGGRAIPVPPEGYGNNPGAYRMARSYRRLGRFGVMANPTELAVADKERRGRQSKEAAELMLRQTTTTVLEEAEMVVLVAAEKDQAVANVG